MYIDKLRTLLSPRVCVVLREERVGETDSGFRGRTVSRGQVTMLATVAFLGLSGICPRYNSEETRERGRERETTLSVPSSGAAAVPEKSPCGAPCMSYYTCMRDVTWRKEAVEKAAQLVAKGLRREGCTIYLLSVVPYVCILDVWKRASPFFS